MSTALDAATLSKDEARSLTDEVKGDAERLWRKLVELYEGGAHEVLGYSSWGSYFKKEFGGSQSRAYELLDAGRVVKTLEAHSAMAESVPNARQARELAPLRDQPEKLREAWSEVVESNPTPTAAQVREVVERHKPRTVPVPAGLVMGGEDEQHATMVRVWDGACRVFDGPVESVSSRVARLVQHDGPGPINSERLDRVAAFVTAAAKALREKGI